MSRLLLSTLLLIFLGYSPVAAEDAANADQELAKKLANPISSLISVPIQFNYDSGFGPDDGERIAANVQPVIPIGLSDGLTLVTRTIVPIIWQDDIAIDLDGPTGEQFGLGDILQSFFFVPDSVETGLGTLTYGAGPVVNWPTSTDRLLGSGTWAAGPTGVFLFQNSGWTYGMLANHLWGIDKTRSLTPDLESTFLQPFVSYSTKDAWTFSLNTEASYNWTTEDWAVPVNGMVSKLVSIGSQKVQLQAGVRYWAEEAFWGAEGIGARFAVTFLFPR